MPAITKYHIKLDGKPNTTLRSNGSVMSDDGDNVVWYIGADRKEYEYHVKSGEWYRLNY